MQYTPVAFALALQILDGLDDGYQPAAADMELLEELVGIKAEGTGAEEYVCGVIECMLRVQSRDAMLDGKTKTEE